MATTINERLQNLGHYTPLFIFMAASGCRISEALDIRHWEISSNGSVLLRGKKGSDNRWIAPNDSKAYLLKCKSLDQDPFSSLNVYSARRHLIRAGVYIQKSGRKNLTMTGIFRELFAKEVRSINLGDIEVSKFIGHKSNSNAKFYGKEKSE